MTNLFALVLAITFTAGSAGFTVAQTPTSAPAEKRAEEKKPEQPAARKKMPVKNASGTVKTASGDSIVVAGRQRKKETEWTFGVDPKTLIRRGGKSITVADLKAGDAVHVRYMDMDGRAVAQSITVKGGGTAKRETKIEKR